MITEFRLWKKHERKMVYFNDVRQTIVLRLDGRVIQLPGTDITNQVEVMQYTGLQDKFNTKIFNHDVVEIDRFDNKLLSEHIVCEVRWAKWNYCLFRLDTQTFLASLDAIIIKNCRVVNHIFKYELPRD